MLIKSIREKLRMQLSTFCILKKVKYKNLLKLCYQYLTNEWNVQGFQEIWRVSVQISPYTCHAYTR